MRISTHCALSLRIIVVQLLLSLFWQHLIKSWQDLVKMQKMMKRMGNKIGKTSRKIVHTFNEVRLDWRISDVP